MIEEIKQIVKILFKKDTIQTTEELAKIQEFDKKYREINLINYTNIFANKLASLTCANSQLIVSGNNQRAEDITKILEKEWKNIKTVTARALGSGLVVLVPYTINGKVYIDHVPQSRLIINDICGDTITQACIKADEITEDTYKYIRWVEYELVNDSCVIRNKATKNDVLVPLDSVKFFEGIPEEIVIPNCEKLLFAIIKCPTDNRSSDAFNGVPITYGSESIIDEIYETRKQYAKEYKLKSPFIAVDDLTLDKDGNFPEDGVIKRFRINGKLENGNMFEIYAPDINSEAYKSRLSKLYEDLEKSVGTSRGFLTEPEITGVTATEINRANYDTFSMVGDIRKQIDSAFEDLKYAIDVIMNYTGQYQMGESELEIIWDKALIESSTEKFAQTAQAVSMGVVKPERLNMLLTGLNIEEAEKEIEEIKEEKRENFENSFLNNSSDEEIEEDEEEKETKTEDEQEEEQKEKIAFKN